jgi:hypothetical protein
MPSSGTPQLLLALSATRPRGKVGCEITASAPPSLNCIEVRKKIIARFRQHNSCLDFQLSGSTLYVLDENRVKWVQLIYQKGDTLGRRNNIFDQFKVFYPHF